MTESNEPTPPPDPSVLEGDVTGNPPPDPPPIEDKGALAGPKLFVVFFLLIVPALGVAMLAALVWQLWGKVHWFQ